MTAILAILTLSLWGFLGWIWCEGAGHDAPIPERDVDALYDRGESP